MGNYLLQVAAGIVAVAKVEELQVRAGIGYSTEVVAAFLLEVGENWKVWWDSHTSPDEMQLEVAYYWEAWEYPFVLELPLQLKILLK